MFVTATAKTTDIFPSPYDKQETSETPFYDAPQNNTINGI